MEEHLSKAPGDPITAGELATLGHLSAGGEFRRVRGVRDLAGIEYAINLSSLDLHDGMIANLEALASLTSLTILHLGYNAIVDIAPLADLTGLTELGLGGNMIADVSPLERLTSLTVLHLSENRISDLASLVANRGLGRGDLVNLRDNPLRRSSSLDTHIPMLLDRGVDVWFDALPELSEIPDVSLREAVDEAIQANNGADLSTVLTIDGAGRGIEDLTGLEGALDLTSLYLDRNRITNISPLAGLNLWSLTLARTLVEDWTPMASIDALWHLALDGNTLREIPPIPHNVNFLSLADNSISDIGYLGANMHQLNTLRMDGNSMNYYSLLELHMRNNAVRDISPLLDGEDLLMVDVRQNPLADDALAVLEALRERRVTVLAGESVPYFPTARNGRQGFVRIVNRSDEAGHVFIEAVDDAGARAGPVRLHIGARQAVHFNSEDLENGNAGKGLGSGIGTATNGDWRLSVVSAFDVEVLSYIRTEDGFVTAMHDVAADAMIPLFNPGSNEQQRSILRVVNTEAAPANWTTGGYDDRGNWRPMAGSMLVRPQHSLTLTAEALETTHGLGDGHGKWWLRVRGFPWFAMSLLESPTGHLTNLSTAPDNATMLADGRTMYRLPLFPAADGPREGFVRVINRSYSYGEAAIEAVDDDGTRSGPVRLALRPRRAAHFNSTDLEVGNAAKGLVGSVGMGEGDWRLEVTSELDLTVLSYARTSDGFLTSLHDLAPVAEDGSRRVVFFNPGSNTGQVSRLRLVNDGARTASVAVTGTDDGGSASGKVTLAVPAGSARAYTSAELEAGSDRLAGRLGDGEGKWRLRVRSDEPIAVMSLLETPTGHLTNVSTATAE